MTGHPDLCPYCRAPISPEQRQRIDDDERRERALREDIEKAARDSGLPTAEDVLGILEPRRQQ